MFHKYTYFYLTTSPFSQWHQTNFTINGITFNCCEQYMMYCKAMLFEDFETAAKILIEKVPREQKELGRNVRNFVSNVWDMFKQDIVYKGNYAKFNQNEDLKKFLFATANTTLVEASPTDTVWGVGLEQNDERITEVKNWRGQNLLGYAITRVREDILKEEKAIQTINKLWNSIDEEYLKQFLKHIDTNTNVLKELTLYHYQMPDIDRNGITMFDLFSIWTELLTDKKLDPVIQGDRFSLEISNKHFNYPFIFK